MVTAHLASQGDSTRVLGEARAILAERGLEHATIQIEPPGGCSVGL
jgi:cobalt-zinc-cadmium efflux system protein